MVKKGGWRPETGDRRTGTTEDYPIFHFPVSLPPVSVY